jgi:hypothetical protein
MGSEQLYSVPSVLVFRSWASNADPDAVIKRRLLLKNDSQGTLSFRLSLPQHPAFQVSGSLVPDAAPGDVCSVTLPAGGSTSLTVTLQREHADEIECRDELCVRMADGWLYVPLVALRDTQQPEGGDPSERRTVPGSGEHWSDADSDDEQRKPSVRRRSSPQGLAGTGRGRSDGKLTAAAVTEADELDFYAELLKAGRPGPAAPPRPANAGEPPSPSSTSSTPARAPHAPPTPRPASRPSSAYEGVQGISQRFSRGAQVRMVKLDASPARAATPRAEAASIAHVAPEWGDAPPHCDDDELAFYRSLLPRHGAPPPRREGQGGGGPAVDPKASARAEARAAIEAGTYFVISGSVCDARGKEIGSVEEVLGPEHAQQGGAPGSGPASDPALDPPASVREVTSSSAKLGHVKLSHAKLGHHQGQPPYMRSDPAQLSAVPAARKGRPDDRILGRGKGDILGLKGPAELKSSAVIKGGGTVVKSAAPKANYLLTERDMQANWDALC